MAEGSQYPEPIALATVAQLQGRFPTIVEHLEPSILADSLVEATAHLEDRCSRRLAPFTGHIFEDRLFGVNPGGALNSNAPVDVYAALGISKAKSLGMGDFVQDFWVDQFAPAYPNLWTYNITSVQIFRSFGGVQNIDFANGGMLGPAASDGHVWLRLGTFAPEGARIRMVFDGGYTLGIPPSLRRACLYQAIKFIILDNEPQIRTTMDLKELDSQTDSLIAPWVRG